MKDDLVVEETLYNCFLAAKDLCINQDKEFFPQFLAFAESADLNDEKIIGVLSIIQDLAFDIWLRKTPTLRNSHRQIVVDIINKVKQEHDNLI